MDIQDRKIRDIEGYLVFLEQTEGTSGNMPVLEKVSDYSEKVNRAEYWRYIHSADHHYFVARVLFLKMVFEYSYFSGFQCIENYLKAYLKCHGRTVLSEHPLGKLLGRCREVPSRTPDFIDTKYVALIVRRFDPYYEVGRYPVQHVRPKAGTQSFLHPDDIFVLDYFVYQMRRMLTVPDNTWDMFAQGKDAGHYQLVSCMHSFPDFYNTLKWNNINFPASLTEGDS